MTAEEINRRVAIELGWSGLENADACIAEMYPYPDKHLNLKELVEATASGWFGWAPGATGPSSVGGEPYEGADKEPTPDYPRDAAAADLVRQEIERRGGTIHETSKPGQEPGTRLYYADVDLMVSQRSTWEDRGRGFALCLAFLAACEASREVE